MLRLRIHTFEIRYFPLLSADVGAIHQVHSMFFSHLFVGAVKNNCGLTRTADIDFQLHSLFTTNPNVMKSLLVAAFMICSCAWGHAQQVESRNEANPTPSSDEFVVPEIPDPLFLISENGIQKEITKEDVAKLSITQIESVEVLMDNESIKEYGDKGRNGVMIISLRKEE